MGPICSGINGYNVKVRRYYRDAAIVKLHHYVQGRTGRTAGLWHTKGTLVGYTDGKLTVYLPELDMEYTYPLLDKKLNLEPLSLPSCGSMVDIVLRTDCHEIKLNRRVIMHLPADTFRGILG